MVGMLLAGGTLPESRCGKGCPLLDDIGSDGASPRPSLLFWSPKVGIFVVGLLSSSSEFHRDWRSDGIFEVGGGPVGNGPKIPGPPRLPMGDKVGLPGREEEGGARDLDKIGAGGTGGGT